MSGRIDALVTTIDRTEWPWIHAPIDCSDYDEAEWHSLQYSSDGMMPRQTCDEWVAEQAARRTRDVLPPEPLSESEHDRLRIDLVAAWNDPRFGPTALKRGLDATITPEQQARLDFYDRQTAELYGTARPPWILDPMPPLPTPYVDWPAFWVRDTDPDEFVIDDVLAKARGHAFWARAEGGKSLLALWLALEAIAAGHVVIYLDWEMTAKDLEDRLSDMGYGPESDLGQLLYALLPDLPMLDTPAGGEALAALVDGATERFPDHHVVVIIDTVGRAVGGEENSNDTWLSFYRYTGVPLKRRGVTWLRLDHTGWEGEHSRGASAKYDDVDVVFEVKKTDSGVELLARKRRMPSVPERVVFTMTDDYPLRFERAAQAWPQGTRETARALDALEVPLNASGRAAQAALRNVDSGRQFKTVLAALKYRRGMAENTRESPRESPESPSAALGWKYPLPPLGGEGSTQPIPESIPDDELGRWEDLAGEES